MATSSNTTPNQIRFGTSFTGYDFRDRRYRIDFRRDGFVRSEEIDRDEAVKIALQILAIQIYPGSSLTSDETEHLKKLAADTGQLGA